MFLCLVREAPKDIYLSAIFPRRVTELQPYEELANYTLTLCIADILNHSSVSVSYADIESGLVVMSFKAWNELTC